MISSLTSHCQTPSPAVTPKVTSVSTGTTVPRTKLERASPTSRTTQAPTVSATNGDSASQLISGPLTAA